LLFVKEGHRVDVDALQDDLWEAFRRALATEGLTATRQHGLHLVEATSGGVSDYVAKLEGFGDSLAAELSAPERAAAIGHYTPWQLLAFGAAGADWARTAWIEYAGATRGRRWITWSPGLKGHFGIQEKEDDDLAAEDQDAAGEVVAEVILSPNEWRQVHRRVLEPRLLDLIEDEGAEGVRRFLMAEGIRCGPPG
jgi:hypothetical protein